MNIIDHSDAVAKSRNGAYKLVWAALVEADAPEWTQLAVEGRTLLKAAWDARGPALTLKPLESHTKGSLLLVARAKERLEAAWPVWGLTKLVYGTHLSVYPNDPHARLDFAESVERARLWPFAVGQYQALGDDPPSWVYYDLTDYREKKREATAKSLPAPKPKS